MEDLYYRSTNNDFLRHSWSFYGWIGHKRTKGFTLLNVHQLVHNLADGPSTSATLNHPVFRREIFGILLNVLETSQTLSLLDTVNEVIFVAAIGRWKAKRLSAAGCFAPLTPWPGALPLDPAGGSAPRPPLYARALRARHASVLLTLNLKIGTERRNFWGAGAVLLRKD